MLTDRLKFKNTFFTALGIAATLFLSNGCNPSLEHLYEEMVNLGFIPYTLPLEFAGTGTMVGGRPKSLNLVAPPQTCFPDKWGDELTKLRYTDKTTVPQRNYQMVVSGEAKVKLIKFLSAGTPILSPGIKFSSAKTIQLVMEGVQIEYFDSVKLTEYYRHNMSPTCKEYLNQVGFIIQALKVEKLKLRFYNQQNYEMSLDMDKLKDIVDIGLGVKFSIEETSVLTIETPKYIGYQLGSLREVDGGMALYRASKVEWDKFQFYSMRLFKDLEDRQKNKESTEEESTSENYNWPPLHRNNTLKAFSKYHSKAAK